MELSPQELAEIILALGLTHAEALLAIERLYFRRLLCVHPSKFKAARAAGMTCNGFRAALLRLQLDDFDPHLPPGDGLVVTHLRMRQGIVPLEIHRRGGRVRVYYAHSLTKDELAMLDAVARRRLRLDATTSVEPVRVDSLEGLIPGRTTRSRRG